jgi:hypothetical protein
VPLRALLRVLQLSPNRFHAWRRLQLARALDDQSACPHTSPHRLTSPEVRAIQDMVTAPEYRLWLANSCKAHGHGASCGDDQLQIAWPDDHVPQRIGVEKSSISHEERKLHAYSRAAGACGGSTEIR